MVARAFDGLADTGLTTGGDAVRFRVELAAPAYIDAVALFGKSDGFLTVDTEASDGSAPLLPRRPLSATTSGWSRSAAPKPVLAKSLTFVFEPARPDSTLHEMEIWGRATSSSEELDESLLPDALYSRVPAGAHEWTATPVEQTVALSTVSAPGVGGTFDVEVGRDSPSFDRAFLVYELAGLPHFTATLRAINGHRALGRFGVSRGAKGGLQVEEIDPASLVTGHNRVQFFPADDHDPGSYRVRNLRIVTASTAVTPSTPASSRAWAALRDGVETTGWKAKSGQTQEREWQFASTTKPWTLDIRLPEKGSGTLTVTSAAAGTKGRVTVRLDELPAGWHRVALGQLPPSGGLTLALAGGRESGAAISELAIAGSPLPADTAPRVVVTYPLSGECVNHRVHARGFVVPAGATVLRANGGAVGGALAPDGSFAFELGEKSLSGAELAIEAEYPSGARARQTVGIGRCVDRPPVVVAEDGRPRQPVEDLGAPFGATVTAGKAAALTFDGVKLEIPAGAVDKDVRITVRPLPAHDTAPLDPTMTNVTVGAQSYRFGPLGMVFKKPVRMTLPYDRKRIPAGFSERDVRTFYYDEGTRHWEQVGLVDQTAREMVAVSEHFTDFINATLPTPEHPGPQSENPTSLKDIKLADPAAGIVQIEPPTPNSSGTANLHFPIETPPGRKGVEPSLAIAYNSESRNGWLGVGWDLRMSAIQIDTRFGVPSYDGTEAYLLDGQALTPIAAPSGAPAGGQYFARRVEGRFDWIQRLGSTPSSYSWVITDKNGTKAYYGENSTQCLSDPSVTAGNIFRWSLSRVRDVFGNEMKLSYERDNFTTTADPEPATQVYPITIDYTSNATTGLAAAYHVDFIRGGFSGSTCDRLDAIIDGRPGFQEATRCLLKQINVRFGSQLVRRYDLTYLRPSSGNAEKTLLKGIQVTGSDGATAFYNHQFEYFGTSYDAQAGGADKVHLFQPPVAWGDVKNADGAPHTADGLSRAKDASRSLELHAGLSLWPGGPGISAGIADTQSGSTVSWDTLDLNGDGLPDSVGNNGLYDLSQLMSGADRTNVSSFSGQFAPLQTHNFDRVPGLLPTFPYPLSNVNRNIVNLHGGITGPFMAEGSWDWTNTARENYTLADVDGDGFVDHVVPGNDGLSVRLNDRAGGFKPAQTWANYGVSRESCSVHNLLGPLENLVFDTVGRFTAPLNGILGATGLGNISLTGAIGDVSGGGTNVIVSVVQGFTSLFSTLDTGQSGPTPDLSPVWERVINSNDPPCNPGPNNSCAGGLTIPVQAGDRLYVRIAPLGRGGGVLKWDPTLIYQSLDSGPLSASDQALFEPEGSSIYRFVQSRDFKPVGRAFSPWFAESDGVVRIDGLVSKGSTSDEVRIRIVQEHADGAAPTVLFAPSPLPANTPTDLPTVLSSISVKRGDRLSFEVLSDLPIDPDHVPWRPIVTYQTYCRTDPDSGAAVCGPVTCGGTPVSCAMAGDPIPEGPVATPILQREALVFYPLFRFEPGMPTQTYVMPTTAPTSAIITGSVTKSAVTPGPVVVAIQGVHGLFLKHVFQPSEIGTVPMTTTTPPLSAHAQLFFTVYSDSDVSGAISWAPMVDGAVRPLNVKIRASGWAPDPSGSGVVDEVMGGGYHGWSFGDWNGSKLFTESQIVLDPTTDSHDFMPLIRVPGIFVNSGATGEAPVNPVDATYASTHFVGRGRGLWKATDTGAKQVFDTAVSGAGVFLLDTLGGLVDDLFCETEHPIRYTEGNNVGVTVGIKSNVSVSAGFNTGDSTTTVEFMDMNGDRYPDSVTSDGVRFNDGTRFGTDLGTGPLPYGDPRHVNHRSVHLEGGLDSAKNLVMMTDAAGHPTGYMGVGLGISYSGSTTDTDLIDINGDGLPDHVKSDPSTGDVLVRLNFGKRFSSEIRWTGSKWRECQVITQQDLLNQFGSDLSTDALRVDDTAINNHGASIGSDTYGAGTSKDNTIIRQLVNMADVNGDGLPDQVLRAPGLACEDQTGQCIKVKFNLGASFDAEKQIPIDAWPVDALATLDSGLSQIGLGAPDALGFKIGKGAMGHVSGGGRILVVDVGGSYYWSSSDTWSSQSFEDIDGDGTLDQVLKTDGDATVHARLNNSGKTNLLSAVYRPLGGIINLDYSREGNQVDSSISIDNPKNQWVLSKVRVYDGRGNAYSDTIDYTIGGPGATPRYSSGHYDRDERESYGYGHVTTVRGVQQADGTFVEGDGSRVDQFFENQSYYLRGLPAAAFESNAFGGVFNGVLHVYRKPDASLPLRAGTFFPAEVTTSNAIYEQRAVQLGAALATRDTPVPTGLAPKYKIERREYDEQGNLLSLIDEGDEQVATDDLRYDVGHLVENTTHITRADSIIARQVSNNAVLRYRTATFDVGKGTLNALRQLVSGGRVPGSGTPGTIYNQASANYTFTYDPYGNLQTYADPTGYSLKYTYDATAQTYRTRVDDLSFGYFSTAAYDLRFGALQQSNDVNNQPETFSFDVFGRVCSVRGPDDQSVSQPATIVMSYGIVPSSCPNGPAAGATFPAYAVTRHKDVQHANDPIDTVTFVDGLGRVIQTKKDFDQDPLIAPVSTGMTVSGQVLFDSRGRVSSQAQPGFSVDPTTTFVVAGNTANATQFGYDALGRQTSVSVPDSATSFITTTIGHTVITPSSGNNLGDNRNWILTTVTDPNGNQHLSYADSRGNRGAVREFNTIGTSTTPTAINTTYAYDPLGQLLGVTDHSGNVISSTYDTEGRMVSLVGSDVGFIEYRYDLNGNMKEKQTSMLRAQSRVISYGYDFNRLKSVTYPNLPQVTYSYGAATSRGDSFGNVAGRITSVTYEAGSEARTYDRLGNVNKTVTTLNRMASTQGVPTSIAFTMKFNYDWLGRMQSMTFPNWIQSNYQILAGEGELVSYVYDHGGNLDRITGFQQTANPVQTSHPRNFTYLNHIGYDRFGSQRVVTSGNGIANGYVYDDFSRRLTDIQADSKGTLEIQQNRPATPFHRLHYTYDKNGNVTHLVNNVSVRPYLNAGVFVGPMDITYTYDNLNQLRSMTGKYRPHVAYGYQYSDTYTYDELGNIVTKAQSQDRLVWDNQTVNTGDTNPVATQLAGSRFDHNVMQSTYSMAYQYQSSKTHAASPIVETLAGQQPSNRSITYDANGNNTGNTFRGDTRVQIWDEENRLKEVDRNGGMLAKYRYDDQGERKKRQTAAGDAWYVNQYFALMPGNMPTKHVFAGETRIATKTDAINMQTPILNFYHSDHLGTTGYTTVTTQNLVQHERYFTYGELWRGNGEQEECDLGSSAKRDWLFTSKEWDVDASLYYFGARYFDPHTDVWQSPDPILASYMRGEGNGGVVVPRNLGLYSYGWNNPVRMRDPDGRLGLDVVAPVAPAIPTAGPPVGPPVSSAPSMGPTVFVAAFYLGYRLGEYDAEHGTFLGFGRRQEAPGANSDGAIQLPAGPMTPMVAPSQDSSAISLPTGEGMSCCTIAPGTPDVGPMVVGPRAPPPLPVLDRTGKVHGDLPKASDLGRYSTDDLQILRGQLEQSVQTRIRVTTRLGPDKAHGVRQAAEQNLIRRIDKHLESQR